MMRYINWHLHYIYITGIPTLKTADDSLISYDAERASVLNQYFTSVFNLEGHFSPPSVQSPYRDIPAFQITAPGVQILLGLNVKNPPDLMK